MFVQTVGLDMLPGHAEVSAEAIAAVLKRMTQDAQTLQRELDRGFRELELRQPALSEFLTGELAGTREPAAQTLSYFLLVVVYRAFAEAFGGRLGQVTGEEISELTHRLIADGELRSTGRVGDSYSEDVVALGQPALVRLLRDEIGRVLPDIQEETPGWREAEPLYEALLLEVLALSHAVAPATPARRS